MGVSDHNMRPELGASASVTRALLLDLGCGWLSEAIKLAH
jgi:hypothetical protein